MQKFYFVWHKDCIVSGNDRHSRQSIQPRKLPYFQKLLDATHLRHEALSNNLANVETPGFKRRDLPKTFSVELRRAVDRKDFKRVKALLPRSAEDRQAKPVRMDGNTVQLDEEMLAMNRNALNYEYLTGAVGGSIKELNLAIKGRV